MASTEIRGLAQVNLLGALGITMYVVYHPRIYALGLFGVTQRYPMPHVMVRFDHTFVVFALVERKNDKQEKRKRNQCQ
jgi:hypothetical protein